MSVAKVSEIIASSPKSFEDAVARGIERASRTLENIRGAWIAKQQVGAEKGKVVACRLTMGVAFVLKDCVRPDTRRGRSGPHRRGVPSGRLGRRPHSCPAHDREARRSRAKAGGGRGIRTPGTVSRTAIFKTAAFNRSAIPPRLRL